MHAITVYVTDRDYALIAEAAKAIKSEHRDPAAWVAVHMEGPLRHLRDKAQQAEQDERRKSRRKTQADRQP